MAGLLDFAQSPEGQGLLAAVAGGMAAARRGQPINTLGTAGVSGLLGYQNAQQLQDNQAYRKQQADALATSSELHKMQMEKLKVETEQSKQDNARKGVLQNFMLDRLGYGAGASAQQQPEPAPAPLVDNRPRGLLSPGGAQAPAPAAGQPPALQIQPPAAQAQAQAPRPAGSYPFSLNDITTLSALGAPGADKLFDMFKYANDGIKREAGNYYRNPMTGEMSYLPKVPDGATITNGGQIVPMPGAAATNAAYKGAETAATERAKAGMDFVTIPMPDGSTRTVRRDQAAYGLGGGGNPGGFGVSQSPANQAYAGETAKASAEQYKQIQNAGLLAPGKIAKFQQLGQMLDSHDGGTLSPLGLQLAQTANSLGMNIDKNLSNKEAAQALANELALALRNTAGGEGMPGAMTDPDRRFLVASVPGLSQSAQGRRKMVEIHTQVLQRQIDVSRMARQWQQRYGRLDAVNPNTGRGFFDNLQQWADKNPLFPQAESQAEASRPSSTGGW